MSYRTVKPCRWLSNMLSTVERSMLLAVFLGAGDMCMSCIRTSCRDCFNPLYLTASTHDTLCTVLCNVTKAFAAPWLTAKSVAANRRFCLNDHCQINPAFISAASSRSITLGKSPTSLQAIARRAPEHHSRPLKQKSSRQKEKSHCTIYREKQLPLRVLILIPSLSSTIFHPQPPKRRPKQGR